VPAAAQGPAGEFAVKRISKLQCIKAGQAEHVRAERAILELLVGQPFVVQYCGSWSTPSHLYLAMEVCAGGELYGQLNRLGRFSHQAAAFYVASVALVFAALHNKKIVYRDLKPENVLLDAQGYVKVADFGLSKVVEWKSFTLCGTPEYLAPEMLQSRGHNKGVDYWGLGVLLYELLAGEAPFTAETPLQIYERVLKGDLKFPAHFDEAAKSIIRHLLVADVTRRYGCLKGGAKDILEHRFFRSLDLVALVQRKVTAPFVPPPVKRAEDEWTRKQPPEVGPDPSDRFVLRPGERDPFEDW
jgi:serine/threonine protein kinase